MVKNKKPVTITLPLKSLEQLEELKEIKQMNKSVLVQIAIETLLRKEKKEEHETVKA